MGVGYLILMGVVCLFGTYEAISFYREYTESKERKDLTRFGMKIIVLVILMILFIWTINTVIGMIPTQV